MTKQFSYKLTGTGWAETTFANEKQSINIQISYLSNPIPDLFKSLNKLINNESSIEKIIFADEPGEHCLTLTKAGNTSLSIEIFWSDEWDETFNPPKNLNIQQLVYSDIDTLENFVNNIYIGIEKLMENLSLKDYKEQWCSHFPSKTYKELRTKFSKAI